MLRHALLALVAVTGLVACGGDGGGDDGATAGPDVGSAPAVVTIQTFQFRPDPVEVGAGTTIRWENEDRIDHTVTAGTREAPEPDRFRGVLEEQGTTFELTLDEPGTYEYFCEVHSGPGMTGEIVVD
jgi:plastocyanin